MLLSVGRGGRGYGLDMTDEMLREAFRVLNLGGRFAVTDIVIRGSIPRELSSAGLDADRLAPQVADKVISAFVRAEKS